MIRLLFHYYKDIHLFNIPFSLFVGVIGASVGKSFWQAFLSTFSVSLLTGGLFLSLYFHQFQHREQYYFYYNRGLSRIPLVMACVIVNMGIVFTAKYLSQYV